MENHTCQPLFFKVPFDALNKTGKLHGRAMFVHSSAIHLSKVFSKKWPIVSLDLWIYKTTEVSDLHPVSEYVSCEHASKLKGNIAREVPH